MLARDIQDRRFATAFRGYDPSEVRQFLAHVAGLYGDMQAKVAQFAEGEVVAVVAPLTDGGSGDDAGTGSGEGQPPSAAAEAALADAQRRAEDVLAAARSEAQTIVSRANDEAARIVLRSRAESRGKPSAERNAAIDAALAEIPGDPEQAREQARLMISEARAVRERILADLAKRRRTAHVQLEQLRVAREKLLETLRDARRVVEDASRDLSTAEVEARLAAETAGRRVAGEAMPSTDELEAELFGGRYAVSPQIVNDQTVREVFAVETVTEVGTDQTVTEVSAVETVREVFAVETVTEVGTDQTVTEVSAVESVTEVFAVEVGTDQTVTELSAVETVTEVFAVEVGTYQTVTEVSAVESVTEVATGVEAAPQDAAAEGMVGVVLADPGAGRDAFAGNDVGRADGPRITARPVGVVDDLFARLRAERTQAAEDARQVLSAEALPKAKKPRTPRTMKNGTANPADTTDVSTQPNAGSTIDTVLVIDVTGDEAADDRQSDDGANTADLGTDPTDIANLVAERLARSIKRHLRDEQGSALVALRTSRGLPSVDSIVGTDTEQLSRLSQVIERSLADAGASLHLTDLVPAVDDIVRDVRSSLATALASVRSGSADAADLSEAIASAYRGWTTERLDALLRRVATVAA